jgi:hypothetical protein
LGEKEDYYFLMDLERTLVSNVPCFWLGNKHGYTYRITEAGLFPKHLAKEIVKNDLDNKTVMISSRLVEETKMLDLKQHEGF